MADAVLTARLELHQNDPADADELFPVFHDPAGWPYDPDGRHADIDRTRIWLTGSARRWRDEGLSYWTVRLRESGRVIGVGGPRRQRDRAWNIYWRIAADAQGRGYATELATAAIPAAHAVDDTVPVIAWVSDRNTPSRRVAEHVGLIDRGEFPHPLDGVPRHAYTDRDLTPRFLDTRVAASSAPPANAAPNNSPASTSHQ